MFTHLHVHTDASPDGLRPVQSLVSIAKAKGFEHIAMTDHGTLANAVAFTIEAQISGIKPIMGLEAYVAVDNKIGHMTILADGAQGWHNLIKLNNLGHLSSFKAPAFTIDQLIAHNKGLVLLSGCVSSPINNLPYKEALALTARLKDAFGSRFFAEVMFISDTPTHERPLMIAKDAGLKVVMTNDAHFPLREDADVHKTLVQLRAGYDYNSKALFLKNDAELIDAARRFVPVADAVQYIEMAYKVGSLIRPVELKRDPTLPTIENAKEKLNAKILDELFKRKLPEEYVKRATYELSVIQMMGYSTYFLILDDIISYARNHGVRIGPGRGSGAGSLVLYLLGCTDIDPIEYDLPFERFLNPERKGMPDVDTDFDSESRSIVLEYAKERWNAKPIATYSRYTHKILTHDLCKVFRVTRDLDEKAADEGEDSLALEQIFLEHPGFEQSYKAIKDQIRHKGTHAGGVIVTDVDVPIERVGNDLAASWTEGQHNELSYAGIVKFDMLGLAALSVIRRLENKFGVKAEKPTDGHPVFSLFREGHLEGIFQFSGSPGIKDLTLKLQPEKFEDLVAINALYRPGALDVGATASYPEWKKSPREVHPLIEDILRPTYGAIVFQEQVMAIFARITGGTLGAADEARRVIVKSKETDPEWVAKFRSLQGKFVSGCLSHGMTKDEAEDLWSELASHSRYSFNKAHSVAYAMVAWTMAWWKYNYHSHFYAEMLNIDPTMSQTYMFAAAAEGLEISPPAVNISGFEYTAEGTRIYMPLSSVKFLSPISAKAIMDARKDGDFVSCEDFMKRVPKKLVRGQARAGLLALDAFEGIDHDAIKLATKVDIAGMAPTRIQQKYLGFVLPTLKIIESINKAKDEGFVAGIVTEVEDKVSPSYGPYKVFRLVPMASFWARGLDSALRVEVGDCVAVVTKKHSGKASRIYKLKL